MLLYQTEVKLKAIKTIKLEILISSLVEVNLLDILIKKILNLFKNR
jgi:hypothetical protein